MLIHVRLATVVGRIFTRGNGSSSELVTVDNITLKFKVRVMFILWSYAFFLIFAIGDYFKTANWELDLINCSEYENFDTHQWFSFRAWN